MPTRRTKGDGGLTLRSDGRWQATLTVETVTGAKTRRTLYGRTKAEAKRKLDAAVRERDTGYVHTANVPTVEAYLTAWMEARKLPPKPLKPNTWHGYSSHIKNHITPALGTARLDKIQPRHIRALYDGMRAKGLAEATVRQVHAILTKALVDAMRREIVTRTPMDRVDPPGTQTEDRDQLTLAQAIEALSAAGDSARWWLAIFYGMRQGECLGLDWSGVDLEAHTLTIAMTLQRGYDHGRTLGTPKAKASMRTLPMVGQIETRLRLLWESAGQPASGPVFVGSTGKRLQPKRDWLNWREFLAAAGLPIISLHAARNTAASVMEAAGIPDRVVAQILGQATVRVTHGYQRAELVRMRQALESAAALVDPATEPQRSRPKPPRALPVSPETP